MKKLFKISLTVLLALSTILISLSACKKKDKTDDVELSKPLDISGYTIVRPDKSLSQKDLPPIVNFKKYLQTFTGAALTVTTDWLKPGDTLDESKPEILIGETNRTATKNAMADLEASGAENAYIIKAVGNKIVLLGDSYNSTKYALKYFLINCAKAAEKGSKTVLIHDGYSKIENVPEESQIFDNLTEVTVTQRSVMLDAGKFELGCNEYPTMVKLQHNGDKNGTILATCEAGGNGYRIFRSTDDAKTWKEVSVAIDNYNKKYTANWMPFIYELPVDIGEYKAGTIILAATSRSDSSGEFFDVSTITLYTSENAGMKWKTLGNVDTAGGQKFGVWEPFLIYEEETKRLYCFYSDDSDPDHDQKLVYKYTTDLKNWSEKKDAVACAEQYLRPGMIAIAKMGNGEYVMTYEMVCIEGNPVFMKKTKNLDDWGDTADYGTQVKVGDVSFGSAPWCAWTSAGGECGTLIVQGKTPIPWEKTDAGAVMMLSFDYGETFIAIENPIPYQIYDSCRTGYSPFLYFAEDPNTLYYMNNPEVDFQGSKERIEVVKIKIEGVIE